MARQTTVVSLATIGGSLVAGGNMGIAGGAIAGSVARWDGSHWSGLGSGYGPFGAVTAIVEYGGSLVAGGDFTTADGIPTRHIARWDGSAWSALGSGLSGGDSTVDALAVYDGALIAAGSFMNAGGVPVSGVARWDGTGWSALGSGVQGRVYCVAVHGGYLVAGGTFATAGAVPVNRIARWDGSAWSAMGAGAGGDVTALTVWNGDLYAGGALALGTYAARWDGSVWWSLPGGTPNGLVWALAGDGGTLFAGGGFTAAGGNPAWYIARYDGNVWSGLGPGLASDILCPAVGSNPWCSPARALATYGGALYVGGTFYLAGGKPSSSIARWADPVVGVAPPGALPDAGGRPHLLPPSPNPSVGSTVLTFDLPQESRVRILVHDLRGALVRVVLAEQRPAGTHRIA